MKKLLAVVLALTMALSLSATAFAADINQDADPKTGNTNVSFSVDPTYMVTIPETVVLDKVDNGSVTYEQTADVTADAGVRLLEDEKIKVTLASDFELKTSDAAAYALPYTVTVDGAEIADGDVVATFDTSLTEQTSTLKFAAADPEFAGEYKDTVTFTIAVVSE